MHSIEIDDTLHTLLFHMRSLEDVGLRMRAADVDRFRGHLGDFKRQLNMCLGRFQTSVERGHLADGCREPMYGGLVGQHRVLQHARGVLQGPGGHCCWLEWEGVYEEGIVGTGLPTIPAGVCVKVEGWGAGSIPPPYPSPFPYPPPSPKP